MTDTLRVFVASSSEQIGVAQRVAGLLQSPRLDVKVWDEETFTFSRTYIESLERELDRADFAVVILTADDSARVRQQEANLPRDNVVFELGLFTGRMGRERCFFFVEAGSGTHIASDLSGVKPVEFVLGAGPPGRLDLAGQAARVMATMLELGQRYKPSLEVRRGQAALWDFCRRVEGHWWERMRAGEDDKSALSYVTATIDPVTNTPKLRGWAYGLAGEPLADWETVITGVILGDTPTIHYRWQGEHDKEKDQTYGGGGFIEFDGQDLATAGGHYYDTNFARITAGAHTRVKHFGLYRAGPDDVDRMKQRWSDDAGQLIRDRLASLRGR